MHTIAKRSTPSTLRATRIIRSTNRNRGRLLQPSVDELKVEEKVNVHASKQNSTRHRRLTRHRARNGSGTCQGRGTRSGSLSPLLAGSGVSRLRDPSEKRTGPGDPSGFRNTRGGTTIGEGSSFDRRRSVGCACAECWNQQGGAHCGLYRRGF